MSTFAIHVSYRSAGIRLLNSYRPVGCQLRIAESRSRKPNTSVSRVKMTIRLFDSVDLSNSDQLVVAKQVWRR